ncbi:MAG: hypothetical protein KDH09_17245 [Chrysiogenetes bacterium]|nr:hypothetical protein [Chrysiogenetes bacterium]
MRRTAVLVAALSVALMGSCISKKVPHFHKIPILGDLFLPYGECPTEPRIDLNEETRCDGAAGERFEDCGHKVAITLMNDRAAGGGSVGKNETTTWCGEVVAAADRYRVLVTQHRIGTAGLAYFSRACQKGPVGDSEHHVGFWKAGFSQMEVLPDNVEFVTKRPQYTCDESRHCQLAINPPLPPNQVECDVF